MMREGYTGTSVIHQVPEARVNLINGEPYGTSLCGVGCALDFDSMPKSWRHAACGGRACIRCADLTPASRPRRLLRWVLAAGLLVLVLALTGRI